MTLEDFFVGSGKTRMRPDEILQEIMIPAPASDTAGA